ncbi:hypothetical protein [Aminivibrio sp.]|uniref:hypothetical protein n=1 Tax=Aminivibrio sp. TaxID=1872489 RepID=UPI00345E8289
MSVALVMSPFFSPNCFDASAIMSSVTSSTKEMEELETLIDGSAKAGAAVPRTSVIVRINAIFPVFLVCTMTLVLP